MPIVAPVVLPTPPESPPRPLLLTSQEAQAELHVSRTALYHLIRAGRLRTVRIGTGNRFRIARAELERFAREEAA